MRPFHSPLVLLLAGLAAAACGGFDAGNPYRVRPGEAPDMNATEPPPGEDGSGREDETSTTEGPDAGTEDVVPSPQDASEPPPATPTIFTGAPAYAATTGPATRIAAHDFAGATPTTNPAGRPCMQCHGAAGPAPRFLIAGTVHKDATGTPAAQIEVRVVGSDGVARTTYSNADGNFFFRASAGAVAFPAKVGARDGNTTKVMTIDAANGNCNSCHRAAGKSSPLVVE
jgi:cytochrome c553